MKELIFNYFGIVGAILMILIGILLENYDLEKKYMDLIALIIMFTSIYGAIYIFDAIGKWILR